MGSTNNPQPFITHPGASSAQVNSNALPPDILINWSGSCRLKIGYHTIQWWEMVLTLVKAAMTFSQSSAVPSLLR
jgi:hypothetical protein